MAKNYKYTNDFLHAYVAQLVKARDTLELEQSGFILGGLDTIIQMSGKIIPPELISDTQRQGPVFDNVAARKIREEAGLSPSELAIKIGFSRYDGERIGTYESGRHSPRNPPKAEFARKYMKWLKRNGYNPYNL